MKAGWRLLSVCGALLYASACGDDAHPGAQSSAAVDSSPPLSHQSVEVAASDPAPSCDRFEPSACGANSRCAVAIRREPGAAAFDVYSACGPAADALALDAACEPWAGAKQRLTVPGLSAEVYLDPCGHGLICSNSPLDPKDARCRPTCDLDRGQLCSEGEFCYSGATPLQSACLPSDRCDPTLRDGCDPDHPCYLRPNDSADGLLTECIPTVTAMPLPDFSACESTFDCQPGSWCWGPATRRPGDWSKAEQYCRRTCDASYDDAQVCDPGLICRELSAAKQVLDFSQVPVPLGQCELN